MTALARVAAVGLVRAPVRSLARMLTLALAVALLAAMILFVAHSLRTMTAAATRAVPLDWQAPVASQRAAVRNAADVAKQPGVLATAPVATSSFTGVQHASGSVGTIRAGAGALLAVPDGYVRHFQTIRFLRGSLRPGGVVLDQQLAATLQAQPGDSVSLRLRPGAPPVRLPVSGVALVSASDVLFQPLNPLIGPAPAQPPANIAIVPLGTFAAKIAPRLPTIPVATSTVPGVPAGTQWQVQAQVDPAALKGSPVGALKTATQIRNRVERSLPGRVVFVDNLGDSLNTAAGDSLYAETLYIMLAVPGALVALGLAYLAALGTADRDRRELSLLRARGARRRDLLFLAGLESVALGIPAGAVGTGVALLALKLDGSAGGISWQRGLAAFALCALLASCGAAAARIGAGVRAFSKGLTTTRSQQAPLWERLYLDVAALVGSGLIYWLTARTGFSAVVNPDSNPTLSLSIYMFFAPALLWIGGALLLVRLRGRLLAWLALRASGGRARNWTGFLLASAGRRGAAINRGLLVVGLLLAFGVSLGLFTATYNQQSRVDAQLTLGADVVVTAPAGAIVKHNLVQQVAHTQGVSAVSAVDHSYAYVGPDLQDTFGIDANTIGKATTLRDSYFLGGSAPQILAALRAKPDGIVVSKETITDYSLGVGDLLKLRIVNHLDGRLHVVPFHVVGIVQEFPAAPRDSFMVANSVYLQRVSHDGGANLLFVHANGNPPAVAQRLAAATGTAGTTVKDINGQTAQTASSITTVNLTGISRIEEAFGLALAAAAMALFVGVGLAERRKELATMVSLGASLRQAAAFLWSEAALVLVAATALAALLGWLLAQMLVAMLQHVFDPPPDHLAAPWGFLAALGGAALVGGAIAAALAAAGIRRFRLGAILREQ
jgi:putative ABC transport system permease protein